MDSTPTYLAPSWALLHTIFFWQIFTDHPSWPREGGDAMPVTPALSETHPWEGVSWGGGNTVSENMQELRVYSKIHEKSLKSFCLNFCDITLIHMLTIPSFMSPFQTSVLNSICLLSIFRSLLGTFFTCKSLQPVIVPVLLWYKKYVFGLCPGFWIRMGRSVGW